MRASPLRGESVSIPSPTTAAGGWELCLAFSPESQLCPCRCPESALGLVSQGQGEGEGGEEEGTWPYKEAVAIKQGLSQRVLPPPRQQTPAIPVPCHCSRSTPMGSEVTSSIPSSVKPAFSSLTYFPLRSAGTMPRSVPCLDPSSA